MFCWFYRLMISNGLDGDNRLSEKTKKHIRHCPSCREFYQTCLSLSETLTRQTAITDHQLTHRLTERVMSAITPQQTRHRHIRFKLRPILAAACLALVLSLVVFFITGRDNQNSAQPGTVELIEQLQALVSQASPAQFPDSIEQPLAGELENLIADTESAARFLVACVTENIPNTKNETIN